MASYCPSLTDVNNLFATTINQFDRRIYAKFYAENPYMSMFPKLAYDYSEGKIPRVLTGTYELPTEYPIGTAIGSITINTGTGNFCAPEPTLVQNGYQERNYQLQTTAFRTNTICLTDLQFDYEAEQQLAIFQEGLTQYSIRWWAMWYQMQNIGMIDTKVSTLASGALDSVTNQDYNYADAGLTLPTAQLEWTHLNSLYDQLARVGGEQFAVGMAGGMPTYSLNVGPGYKRKLWQTDSKTRETVNWGNAFENFTARGINTAIDGFLPNVDQYIPRYDASLRLIPPFINVNTTKGRKFIVNPAYYTPSRGGNATYEVFSVTARDIYEVRVAPGGPTQFSGASFNPQNYAGEVQWINNRDMCNNQLGNNGFYRMDIRVAPKPIFPENGFAGITIAYDGP